MSSTPFVPAASGGATQDATSSHHTAVEVDNREVEVWVRDANGMKYPVKMPISSRLAEVMQKVGEQHGRFFEGTYVGFKGGRNPRTTVAGMLQHKPADDNEEDYLYLHPIQPKFKRECLIL